MTGTSDQEPEVVAQTEHDNDGNKAGKTHKLNMFDFSNADVLNNWKWIMMVIAVITAALGFWFGHRSVHITEARLAGEKQAAEEQSKHLHKVADEAVQRARRLEEKHLPRTVTPAQKQILIERLKRFAGNTHLRIDSVNMDAESAAFTDQMFDAITSAGITPKIGGGTGAGAVTGTAVVVHDSNSPPALAIVLLLALEETGVNSALMDTSEWRNDGPEDVIFLIGAKPAE
jgi:hypothetical protein